MVLLLLFITIIPLGFQQMGSTKLPKSLVSGPASLWLSAVDLAETIRQLMRSWPPDAHENIKDFHKRGMALAVFSQYRPILCEISLDHADDEVLSELLILITLRAAGFHDLADREEHVGRIEGSKIHQRFNDGMGGVRMPHGRELFQERLRQPVKLRIGELLADEQYFSEVARRLPSNWPKKNLQIVLSVPVVNHISGRPRVLATHVW